MESKIGVLHFQVGDFWIIGLFVAFLVFMALKVKPKTLAEFLKPFYHVRAKNNKKSFLSIWPLMWPSKNFFGLFHFNSDILCLRSLMGCSKPISNFNIIQKGNYLRKWFEFLISNHSGKSWTNQVVTLTKKVLILEQRHIYLFAIKHDETSFTNF